MLRHKNPLADAPSRFLILPVWILAIYALGALMSEAATICLWIVCAFFLFVLLDPAAQLLKRKRWPTALAAIFLILVSLFFMVGTIYTLGSFFSRIVVELEHSKELFLHSLDLVNTSWTKWATKLGELKPMPETADNVQKVQLVQSSPLGGEFGGTILHGLGSAATLLTFAILVPILAFFFLAERDGLARVLAKAYEHPGAARTTWEKIVKSTRAFFVGNLVLGIVTYPLFVALFWFFNVPSLLTVSALATVFNLVPFAGSILSGFLPALALYAQSQEFGAPLALYGSCLVIHFIIADFVTPKLLGSQVNINATASTIALVAWGEMWGSVGLILAIPLTSLIKILFEHSNFFWLQWIAHLLSEDVDHALKAPTLRKEIPPVTTEPAPEA